jgi:hypothetical protein
MNIENDEAFKIINQLLNKLYSEEFNDKFNILSKMAWCVGEAKYFSKTKIGQLNYDYRVSYEEVNMMTLPCRRIPFKLYGQYHLYPQEQINNPSFFVALCLIFGVKYIYTQRKSAFTRLVEMYDSLDN